MRSLLRAALSIAAVVLLWFALVRSVQFSLSSRQTTEPSLWLSWLGLVAIAGFLIGVALVLPRSWSGYRWQPTLIVAALPLLLIAYFVFLYGFWIPDHPPYSIDPAFLLWGKLQSLAAPGPQFALAMIVGVAFGTGFGEGRSAISPTSPIVENTPDPEREPIAS